jgi:hypothetical protein
MIPADCEEEPRPGPPVPPGLGSCVVGETIRTVRVWDEARWEAMDPACRPSAAEFVPGVGWVSAGPVRPPGAAGGGD